MKRIVTLALVISLVLPPVALLAKERRGANIEITKSDGMKIKGELIAIKQNSTLLFESSSGIGESIDVSEIKSIKIIRKSGIGKIGLGAGLGLLIGAGAGAAIVVAGEGNEPPMCGSGPLCITGSWVPYGAAIGGILGTVIGFFVGIDTGIDEKITISRLSPAKMAPILKKLRKKARFPECK